MTSDNPLTNPHVRDAIELLRDYGVTAEQYAAADLTSYWAVPGVEAPFTDERAALDAAQARADHLMERVAVTRMAGAAGDFVPLDSRVVHPRLVGCAVPYALYATATGGEPIATVDVDGVVAWPAGQHPGDPAPDVRAPFVVWAAPIEIEARDGETVTRQVELTANG